MKLATFFEKFDQFVEAPNAVAKMRELVLELASQGKLVKQKSDEGDGHALLRQIYRKNPPLLTDKEEEPMVSELASFPKSWAQSKLGEVTEIIRGVTFPGSAKSGTRTADQVACLRTASVQAEIDWDDLIFISPTHVGRSDQWVAPNDIIISMANSFALVGKVAIVRQVPQKATFGGFLAAIRPILIEPYFLLYVLRSPRMQAAFRASSSQTTNIANISLGRMRPLPFPLPPLAEQKRIVAKVDELMALCDQLEAQQQERETRHAALARASLTRFAEAPTPANLNFLFHKSYTIQPADLRKSILTLAVRGKLVPQDPNDEQAEEVLARIAAAKMRFQQSGELGKEKPVEPLQPNDLPFEAPVSWCWAKLAEVTELITKGSSPKWQGIAYVPKSEGILFITSENVGNYNLRKLDDLKYVAKGFNEIEPRSILKFGDILMNLVGASIGRTAVYDLHDGANINQAVALIRLVRKADGICPRFLLHYLNSPAAVDYMLSSRVVNAQPNISLTDAREFAIPIPPLAEQRRIVAKVDQLMSLVDKLETQLADSRATASNLLSAIVAELSGTTSNSQNSAQPEPGPARRGRPRKLS